MTWVYEYGLSCSCTQSTQPHHAQHSAGLATSLITLAAGVAGVAAPEAGAILGDWIITEDHLGAVSIQRRGDVFVSHPR